MARLRPGTSDDLDFIARAEADPSIADYVSASPRSAHLANLAAPDFAYRVGLDSQGDPVGYAILAGLKNAHRTIELRSYAIARRGRGFGRALLDRIMREVFVDLGARRLWLDVFPQNAVARHLYQQAGFAEEGLMRDCYLWHGKPQSSILMAILASDYRARDFQARDFQARDFQARDTH